MRGLPDRPLGLAPASVRDYRELARRRLPRQIFDYVDGGANEESTLGANLADLHAIQLRQRVLRDVSKLELSTAVLGQALAMPIVLAPVGMGGMLATRAEVQAARAAADAGVAFCESTVSICSLEEVRAATSVPFWFQLYVMRDRSVGEQLMERAAAVGCPVLLLTVDLPVTGARYRETRNGLTGTVPPRKRIVQGIDFALHPSWAFTVGVRGRPHTFGNLASALPGAVTPRDFKAWIDGNFDPSVTWADLAWVREHWRGRLVLKGILDPEDARQAADAGVDGIVVSNHGGRQLDDAPSTVAALPRVVDAVGDAVEVLVDGGIRSGLDVAKMLALGARACLVGRAWAWSVAAGGQAGVAHMLRIMRGELEVALSLTGAGDVAALDRSALAGHVPE
jgi:L-lactate dehydrogenase (cytochrome)